MFDYSRKPVKWQVGNFSNVTVVVGEGGAPGFLGVFL